MKKWFILIVLLIVGLVFVPSVSAEESYDSDYGLDNKTGIYQYQTIQTIEHDLPTGSNFNIPLSNLRFSFNPSLNQYPETIYCFNAKFDDYSYTESIYHSLPAIMECDGYCTYNSVKMCDVHLTYIKSQYPYVTIVFEFDNWNKDYLNPLSDPMLFGTVWTDDGITPYIYSLGYKSGSSTNPSQDFSNYPTAPMLPKAINNLFPASDADYRKLRIESTDLEFKNGYNIYTETLAGINGYIVKIDRESYIESSTSSSVIITTENENYTTPASTLNWEMFVPTDKFNVTIIPTAVLIPQKTIWDSLTTSIPVTPTPTVEPTLLRTGTVTMTDNNGTTISGFDIRAVNHYTGKEYTVSTATDVAVITLPMDRTVEIRNPQTGEYEEAPIGYYRFFGYKPGYKMLNEGGIQVSVMPEKYSSYQLCDIRVTSETGDLTGKHQFQLRSRSDYSILQTGTISAQSATTNEWYNTTVIDGIATLILPYDTSNPISQYAGNYYVYATSPGYQDSEYGTQIVVMPHTTSEINTILLTPIGGIPTPGNVTLRIQAFSETGHGIPNAGIFIAGVLGAGKDVWNTYTASSTGYLEVSVPGNSTYDIVASGAGYYDSARRITVYTEDPPLIEIKLYLSGAPTVEPTTQPTGWITTHPTTQPTGGIPDDDDGSESFLMQAVRGIGKAFGVGFATAKLIFGALLALSIGFATAKQLRGGAAEFGLGLLGGTMLGVLIGLLPVWIIVVLLLVVGLYIGHRYVGGGNNG